MLIYFMRKNKQVKMEKMEIFMQLTTETCANVNYSRWKREVLHHQKWAERVKRPYCEMSNSWEVLMAVFKSRGPVLLPLIKSNLATCPLLFLILFFHLNKITEENWAHSGAYSAYWGCFKSVDTNTAYTHFDTEQSCFGAWLKWHWFGCFSCSFYAC